MTTTSPSDLPWDLARAALDLVENMLVVTDRGGAIVYVNDAFTQVTGYSAHEAIGATPAILRSGVQDDDFYAQLWSRILAGGTWDGELVNRRRDGTLYTDRMTITPLRDNGGTICNFVAVKRDVSSHLAALTAGSPSGAAHLDATASLVYANPRLEQLLGRRFDELLGEHWLLPITTDGRTLLRDAIGTTATTSEAQRLTIPLRSGTTLRVHIAPLDVGGDGPAGVVATFEDVSIETRATHELREREQYARAILDSMASPTAIVDGHGVVTAVNAAWSTRASTHGARAQDVGAGVDYLEVCRRAAATGCSEAAATRDAIQAVVTEGTGVHTIDYASPEDSSWWEVRITPLHTTDGGAVLVHQDISARYQLAEVLRQRASTDALTGLHNRTGLADRAEPAFARAQRTGVPPTALYLDLDRFKPINDEHGHDAGDHVLQVCARRLSEAARETDVVARVGGDEFVVLCEGLTSEQANDVAARIRTAIQRPMTLPDGAQVSVGVSIGVGSTAAAGSLEELLSDADERMYRVKNARDTRGD